MGNQAAPIVITSVLLVIDVLLPLAIATLAARDNWHTRVNAASEIGFWLGTVAYLAIVAATGSELVHLVSHPQVEGLATLSFTFIQALVSAPGSVVSLIMSAVLSGMANNNLIPRPAGLLSLSIWLVVGSLCWAVFNTTSLRWLINLPRRRALRSVPAPPTTAGGETAHRAE